MNTGKRVHYLQHVDFEGLGYIQRWLLENKLEYTATKFYEPGAVLPDPADIDILIIMGGPMSIYDENRYVWLKSEKVFIKNCIAAGKKVLGICLGAQLIADVLGAAVHKAMYKEIGWFPVRPAADSASKDRTGQLLTALFSDHPTVFHWHGDQFELPGGAADLLNSVANGHQAFTLNESVIGLQFHLEVTEQSLERMLEKGGSELGGSEPYVQAEERIRSGSSYINHCNRLMQQLLNSWIS